MLGFGLRAASVPESFPAFKGHHIFTNLSNAVNNYETLYKTRTSHYIYYKPLEKPAEP